MTGVTDEQLREFIEDLTYYDNFEGEPENVAMRAAFTELRSLRTALRDAKSALEAGAAAIHLRAVDPATLVVAPLAARRCEEYASTIRALVGRIEG
jgi:hypothetical protein